MNIVEILNKVDNLVWGAPLLILLMGTGIYLTVKLGLLQITKLPLALKYLFQKDKNSSEEGDVWIYVNILDTIFFVFYEYFFSNSIGLKYPNLL